MAVSVISNGDYAALYCTTSDWAFGPVFTSGDCFDAGDRAEHFLVWLCENWGAFDQVCGSTGRPDPRNLSDSGFRVAVMAWENDEAQYGGAWDGMLLELEEVEA